MPCKSTPKQGGRKFLQYLSFKMDLCSVDLARENSYLTPYANTSILPMLLLSLMQQRISPKTASSFNDEYDYIIVGAGSAGSTLASRLSEVPCVTVLLLEAGKAPPLVSDIPGLQLSLVASDYSWNYDTVPQKHTAKAMVNNQVFWPSGKALGGSSILNGMVYTRGNHHNYDDWARQGAVGWSYSDVKPYFLKLEDNHTPKYLANGYHVVGGPVSAETTRYSSELAEPILKAARKLGYRVGDPNGRIQTGFDLLQLSTRKGQRCSTAKAYLVPAENRTNLHILPDAFVRKVRVEDRRAIGVEFDHGDGTHFVRAKREVIMSAGTINSAQLLMLSGIGPKEHLEEFNIPVVKDLPLLKNETNVQDYIKNRRGPLSYVTTEVLAFLQEPSSTLHDSPDYQLYFGLFVPPDASEGRGIKPEIIEEYFANYKNSTLYACFAANIKPKSRGTVKLQSSNPYDGPLIDPNYFENPEDFRPMVEGFKTCMNIGKSKHLKRIGSKHGQLQ
ncbi:hypothetical protein JTE90_012150 [Oedothorax gibbosus]|uniref:Glucose-methanol-choline oxidoreductase N-terminal domain-containing protein n=1 Tax=Oedothorax gibbosus TaxID=931172 RepID=A0AAV6UJR6_9ARAC|nr:hypothetical protein JTE90_012150 [Oedothorax gibbosus]